MITRSRVLLLLAIGLVIALAFWLRNSIEWVDAEVRTLPKNEAARDRFYAAKALVRQLGGQVVSRHGLDPLPPAGATLLLSSVHWKLFPGREQALRRWVQEGGRLVLAETPVLRRDVVPEWIPIRAVVAAPAPAASAGTAGAGAASAGAASAADRRRLEHCREYREVEALPAFGAARSFRLCAETPSRLRSLVPAQWTLQDSEGERIVRVPFGQGSVTVSVWRGAFIGNGNVYDGVLADDSALVFAAALGLAPGDVVWFVDDEARPPFLRWLWAAAAPALLFAGAALGLALWRGGARFGPLAVEPAPARRSIGEQVRRTAAFVAGGSGEALHRAALRALEARALRVVPGYGSMLTLADRAAAIAARSGSDPAALAGAMHKPARRQALASAVAELERARRALLPDPRALRVPSSIHAPSP
ncbi:MAG: DUF4350 domain-containing protein [Caldimonas sp.]